MNVAARSRDLVGIEIADAALCAAACREIYAQRPNWRPRRLNDQPPFYTLGVASYMDLGFDAGALEAYLAEAGSLWRWAGNAVLTLIERVRTAMSGHLERPVEFPPMLPSPGFHIFVGRAIPRTSCARMRTDCRSCHFDTQYNLIPWERWYTSVDLEDTVSFTLPLNLPAEGGGLNVWESLTLDWMNRETAAGATVDLSSQAHVTPFRTIHYSIGRLVLHDGHLLHQVAGVPRVSVTDERITLQGHGVLADGVWRLYW